MTNTPHPQDRQIAELLRSLENDTTKVGQRRDEILSEVLAHYDERRVVGDKELNVVLIAETSAPSTPSSLSRLWIAAAAVLLVIVAGTAMIRGPGADPTRIDTAGESEDEPVQETISSGRMQIFSGGLQFDAPDGLLLSERTSEVALLSRDPEPSGLANTIVVLDRGSSRFANRVASEDFADALSFRLSQTRANGRQVDRWTISLTQLGASELDCTINLPCFEVIDGVSLTAITSGTQVTVTELIASDGNAVLFLADDNGPLRVDLAAVLATVEAP